MERKKNSKQALPDLTGRRTREGITGPNPDGTRERITGPNRAEGITGPNLNCLPLTVAVQGTHIHAARGPYARLASSQ